MGESLEREFKSDRRQISDKEVYEEIVKALRLVETQNKRLIPNIAGLLLFGREEVLQEVLPTHEVNFQVIDAQGNVKDVPEAPQRLLPEA